MVGLGNALMGDDGAGPTVVELLRLLPTPASVRLEHLATDVLNLPRLWRGEPEVWLVDAIVSGAPAGTLHRLQHDRVMALPQRHATVHHLSLPESLRWIALAHPEMAAVRYTLHAVEAARVLPGESLSQEVAAACEHLAATLADDVGRSTSRAL